MLRFDKAEIDRTIEGNVGGSSGRLQTIGVFLPDCDTQADFHASLSEQFEKQMTPGSDTRVQSGRFPNQIVVIKVSSLMPVRFIDGLRDLKHHYDGLCRDKMEAHLLHGEGDGRAPPPLYARTSAEVAASRMNKPTLAARLLNIVRQRQNKKTGIGEWVLVQMVDDLPSTTVLSGKTWSDVLTAEHPQPVAEALRHAVKAGDRPGLPACRPQKGTRHRFQATHARPVLGRR